MKAAWETLVTLRSRVSPVAVHLCLRGEFIHEARPTSCSKINITSVCLCRVHIDVLGARRRRIFIQMRLRRHLVLECVGDVTRKMARGQSCSGAFTHSDMTLS